MPGGFPLGYQTSNWTDVGSNLSTVGVNFTCGNGTKGSWAQLTASAPTDICGLQMRVHGNGNTKFLSSVDLGIGAAGSEKVILSDFMIPSDTSSTAGATTPILPISIKAGTRIAARGQAPGASETNQVCLSICDGSFTDMEGCSGVDGMGFDAVNTHGVQVTSGAANTKGSYSEIIASTTRDYVGLFLGMGPKDGATTLASLITFVDIAIGAAGSEIIILPNIWLARVSQVGIYSGAGIHFYPVSIPAGTRLALRFSALAAAVVAGFQLYGVYQ
jgi:hypothetical protein